MTTSVSTNFWKRFKRLRVNERVIDFSPIERAVGEYFDAGNHDIIALADSMCLTPRELYFMMSTDSLRCNILPALPAPERHALTEEIRARAFSRNEVMYWAGPSSAVGKHHKHLLDDVLTHLGMVLTTAWGVTDSNCAPIIEATPYLTAKRERGCTFTLRHEDGDFICGDVYGLTVVQQKILTVKYGQPNPS